MYREVVSRKLLIEQTPNGEIVLGKQGRNVYHPVVEIRL